MTALRFVAHGGGVQTTALLVLAAQGRIDYRVFLFANVGDDSEDPGTLAYLEHVARPYANHHGVEIRELVRVPGRGRHRGSVETLFGRLTRHGSRSLPIPVRMSDSGAPGTRSCTVDFKIRVLHRHIRELGASEANPATMALGFSLDEIHRIGSRDDRPFERLVYPLVSVGDETGLRLNRASCEALIVAEPLPSHIAERLRDPAVFAQLPPVTQADLRASRFTRMPRPPKSACWFCPLHQAAAWSEMHRDRPELFERAAGLEDLLNERRVALGRDPVYLHRRLLPLRVAAPAAQDMLDLDDDGSCDDSSCFT